MSKEAKKSETVCVRRPGYSIFEIIVAMGIMSILVGATIPMAMKKMEQTRVSKVRSELAVIQKSLYNFHEDTRRYPIYNGSSSVHYLYTTAIDPRATKTVNTVWHNASGGDRWYEHMIVNGRSYSSWDDVRLVGWNGPYMTSDPADPWGNGYLIAVAGFHLKGTTGACWQTGTNGCQAWALSLGVDEALDTGHGQEDDSDDLDIRLKLY